MNSGILLIDKPKNYTSRDIVNIVSKHYKTKKVGHTGTLDPLATGVLVITLGNCTKLTDMLISTKKEYIATAILGIHTDTLDITGKKLKEKPYINKNTEQIVNSFKGKYMQEVPIYSAVKVKGKKLYEYARNNEDVILPIKEVEIFDIQFLEENKNQIKFKCTVSKGTYIRSLIRDIAKKLDTYGVMSDLRRTKQGDFKIEDTNTINNLNNIITLEQLFENCFTITPDEQLEKKIRNGVAIPNTYKKDTVVFKKEKIIAIYKDSNNILKPYKMFIN